MSAHRTKVQKPESGARAGLPLALRAFELLSAATEREPLLRVGRAALPQTEGEARARALRILEVLEEAQARLPDRLVLVEIARDPKERGPLAWHVVPSYRVSIPPGPPLEAVIDPFLRRAPVGIADWQGQLEVDRLRSLDPEELIGEREAMVHAPDTIQDRYQAGATTRRGGSGTPEDGHVLARLVRAWLRNTDEDASHIERFRALFGEAAWRTLVQAYPKLVAAAEAEVAKRKR